MTTTPRRGEKSMNLERAVEIRQQYAEWVRDAGPWPHKGPPHHRDDSVHAQGFIEGHSSRDGEVEELKACIADLLNHGLVYESGEVHQADTEKALRLMEKKP